MRSLVLGSSSCFFVWILFLICYTNTSYSLACTGELLNFVFITLLCCTYSICGYAAVALILGSFSIFGTIYFCLGTISIFRSLGSRTCASNDFSLSFGSFFKKLIMTSSSCCLFCFGIYTMLSLTVLCA